MNGNIDNAINLINTMYSGVLVAYPNINMLLSCQKFVEMICMNMKKEVIIKYGIDIQNEYKNSNEDSQSTLLVKITKNRIIFH